MKKVTEKFENGVLVERITEESTAPGPFATGGVIPTTNIKLGPIPGVTLSESNTSTDGVR